MICGFVEAFHSFLHSVLWVILHGLFQLDDVIETSVAVVEFVY